MIGNAAASRRKGSSLTIHRMYDAPALARNLLPRTMLRAGRPEEHQLAELLPTAGCVPRENLPR
jgi:hypothetical protein